MKTDKIVRPLPGYVILEPQDAETKTSSGLVLPDSSQEKPEIGKVHAKGGYYMEFGDKKDIPVKKGDTVVYKKYTGQSVKVGTKEYEIVAFKDILSVIE